MKIFTPILAIALFIFQSITHSFCQKLNCLSDLSVSLSRLNCTVTIRPEQLTNQAEIFDSLIIDNPHLEKGTHTVKLFAIKNNINIDSCTSNIKVYAPNFIVENFYPDTLHVNTSKPYKILPEKINALNYASTCFEQKITIKPEYIYCYDPTIKLVFIRYTDNDGEYYEIWKELYIVRKADDPCSNKEDKTENVLSGNLINTENEDRATLGEDELISRETYDIHGNPVSIQDTNSLLGKGIFIVKTTYSNGHIKFKKVIYLD